MSDVLHHGAENLQPVQLPQLSGKSARIRTQSWAHQCVVPGATPAQGEAGWQGGRGGADALGALAVKAGPQNTTCCLRVADGQADPMGPCS